MSNNPTYDDLEDLARAIKSTALDGFVTRQILALLLGEVSTTKDDPAAYILKVTEFVQAKFDEAPMVKAEDSAQISRNLESIRRQALQSQGL